MGATVVPNGKPQKGFQLDPRSKELSFKGDKDGWFLVLILMIEIITIKIQLCKNCVILLEYSLKVSN